MSSIRNRVQSLPVQGQQYEDPDQQQGLGQTIAGGANQALLAIQQTLGEVGQATMDGSTMLTAGQWEAIADLARSCQFLARTRKKINSGWNRKRNRNEALGVGYNQANFPGANVGQGGYQTQQQGQNAPQFAGH